MRKFASRICSASCRRVSSPKLVQLGVTQRDQTRIEMLGQHAFFDRVFHQPPRKVELRHRRPAPVDHLRRQHAPHAPLLAQPGEQKVHPRRVHLRQLRQIADSHHHLTVWPFRAGTGIPLQRRGETKSNWLQYRVDSERSIGILQEGDRLAERVPVARPIGDRHHLGLELRDPFPVRRLTAQYQFRTRLHPPLRLLLGRSCRSKPGSPESRSRVTQSPTPAQLSPGMHPTSITSAPPSRSRTASATRSSRLPFRRVIDLRQ